MKDRLFTPDERGAFLRAMAMPLRVFVGLMLLLGTNVMLGVWRPFPEVWIVELGVLAAMIAVTLLFAMEIREESPLIRMWSMVGFCWLAVLFGMTLVDYLTRGG